METVVTFVFLTSMAAVVPAFAAAIYCSYSLNRYLKDAHPEVWARIAPNPLAEPSLSSPNSHFVTRRTYRSINDQRLNVLGDRCFRLLYIAATVFLVLILSGLSYDVLA